MKEIKPSDAARVSGGATNTITDSFLDPSPLPQAHPIDSELAPKQEPITTVTAL